MRFIRKHHVILSFVAALIPAVVAAWPLFGARFIPTHDGEYHIIRFWQFHKMLSYGFPFPRWAPDLNNGYGMPLFTFNYPFPNYVGSMFRVLGLSFVDSFKWTLAAGYLLAQLFTFFWLQKTYGRKPATVGVIAGSYVPYWFVDLYVRGSVGEVWALAWVFGALFSTAYANGLLVTITVALLIVSHNILALIFVPFLFLYAFVTRKDMLPAILLGIGLSSFFWIPALYERQFVTGLSPVNLFDHFPDLSKLLIPSWGTGFRGSVGGGTEMSYQIGIAPLILLLAALCTRRRPAFFVLSMLAGIVVMLPLSQPLWRALPISHFVQYPWRLLSLVIVATPVMAAAVTRHFRFGWLIAVLAVLLAFGYSRPVTYEPRTDAEYLSRDSFTKGTSSLGNALQTVWMSSTGAAHASEAGVIVPVAYYPGWYARVDGKDVRVSPSFNGFITVPVSLGEHTFEVMLGDTWWQRGAAILSAISLFVAVVSFILGTGAHHAYRDKHIAADYRAPHARNRRVHAKPDRRLKAV